MLPSVRKGCNDTYTTLIKVILLLALDYKKQLTLHLAVIGQKLDKREPLQAAIESFQVELRSSRLFWLSMPRVYAVCEGDAKGQMAECRFLNHYARRYEHKKNADNDKMLPQP